MENSLIFYYEEAAGQLISVFLPAAWYWKSAKPLPAKKILKKSPNNPLFGPRADKSWESVAAFNPTAFQHEGKIYLLTAPWAMTISRLSVWQPQLTVSPSMNVLTNRLYPRASFEGAHGKIDYSSAGRYSSGGGWAAVKIPKS